MGTQTDFQLSLLQLSPLEETHFSMLLPLEGTYNSKDELFSSIQAWAAEPNYTFFIGRSRKINNGERAKILYICNCAGLALPSNFSLKQDHKRQTLTRKTGYKLSVNAVERTNGQCELYYRPGREHSIRNHPPSRSISSYPVHRKLAQEEYCQARVLYEASITLRDKPFPIKKTVGLTGPISEGSELNFENCAVEMCGMHDW